MRELAKNAGHDLDFAVISKQRMIRASIAANDRRSPGMLIACGEPSAQQ
jgi:hypothetical protein